MDISVSLPVCLCLCWFSVIVFLFKIFFKLFFCLLVEIIEGISHVLLLLNYGLRFGCNHGSNDQICHSCSMPFGPLGSYASCGHFCCKCSTSFHWSHALRDHVHVVCLDRDSYELYVQFYCRYSSMDHLVIGYSHEQYDRYLLHKHKYRIKSNIRSL